MGELHGDEMRTAYEKDGVRLFEIDDGETHVYAAKHSWDALKYHFGGHDLGDEWNVGGSENVEITLIDGDTSLKVTFVDDADSEELRAGWPAHWKWSVDGNGRAAVSATAAEWATCNQAGIERNGASLISTTVC